MATFNNQSPSVKVVEQDYSAIVDPAPIGACATVGTFTWGPANEVVLVTTESELARVFGKPSKENYAGFFTAANLLSYTTNVKVARVVSDYDYNAVSGGNGSGLTLDVNVLNGKVSSVAIANGGSGYIIGDLVEVDGGQIENAIVRVSNIDNGGVVTGVELLTNGAGYAGNITGGSTTNITKVQVKNDVDFELQTILPDFVAKYPSALGNSIGVGIVRASEFDRWKFKARFIRPPAADVWKFDGDGRTKTFTMPAELPADAVVTVNGNRREPGTTPGTYSATGTTLTINTAVETFTADGATYQWPLANTAGIDIDAYIVKVNGSEVPVNADPEVELPYGQARVTNGVLEIGTNVMRFSGDGVTGVFTIVGVTGITDAHVWVDGVEKTVVATAPTNPNEVQVVDNGTNTDIVFYAGAEPAAGINNVVIRWGYLANGTTVEIEYGIPPKGAEMVKVFFNQTEVHIVVFDSKGWWTDVEDTILETFGFVSLDPNAKDETGLSNYYMDVLNRKSAYVRIKNQITEFGDYYLSHGTDAFDKVTDGDYWKVWDLFKNKEKYDVSHLVPGDVSATVKKYVLENIAEYRKDCIAWIAPERDSVVYNPFREVDALKKDIQNYNSTSFGAFVDNWKLVYDRYNDRNAWIPCDSDGAGIYSRAANNFYPWVPGAGYNRGHLNNVIELAWSASKEERDELYPYNINSIFFDPRDGYVLLGNKTMLAKASAFDRINTRMLFILLEKSIANAAKYFIMELNTPFTRTLFKNMIVPFLRDVKNLGGIEDFRVVVDERNNPPSVRARHELIADILIKPTYSVEYVTLKFSAVGPDISFDYIINEKITNQ